MMPVMTPDRLDLGKGEKYSINSLISSTSFVLCYRCILCYIEVLILFYEIGFLILSTLPKLVSFASIDRG